MEVILLWKKTKRFFGLSIIPNIITEKWGYKLLVCTYKSKSMPYDIHQENVNSKSNHKKKCQPKTNWVKVTQCVLLLKKVEGNFS